MNQSYSCNFPFCDFLFVYLFLLFLLYPNTGKRFFNSIQMLCFPWHQYSSFRDSHSSVLKLNLHFNAIASVFNYVLFPDIGVKTSYRMTDIFILLASFACKWAQLKFTGRERSKRNREKEMSWNISYISSFSITSSTFYYHASLSFIRFILYILHKFIIVSYFRSNAQLNLFHKGKTSL
jgi:hypothetical protein